MSNEQFNRNSGVRSQKSKPDKPVVEAPKPYIPTKEEAWRMEKERAAEVLRKLATPPTPRGYPMYGGYIGGFYGVGSFGCCGGFSSSQTTARGSGKLPF